MKIQFIFFLVILSCSQVNTESKDYYNQKKNDSSHGFKINLSEVDAGKTVVEYDSAKAAKGKKVYQENCLQCHGKNGEGDGPMAKKFSDKPLNIKAAVNASPHFKFFIDISKTANTMPGWKGREFKNSELINLTHYLRTFIDR